MEKMRRAVEVEKNGQTIMWFVEKLQGTGRMGKEGAPKASS